MEANQRPYEFKAHEPLQRFIDYMLDHVAGEEEIDEL